jgi:hypothetical protein
MRRFAACFRFARPAEMPTRLHDRQQIDEVRRLREITWAQLVQRDPTQPLH